MLKNAYKNWKISKSSMPTKIKRNKNQKYNKLNDKINEYIVSNIKL